MGTIKEKNTRSVRDYLRLPFIRLRQLVRQTLRRRATLKRRKTLKKKDIVHTTADAVRRSPSQQSLRRTASTASLRRQPSTRGLKRKPSQSRGGIRKSKSTSRRQSRYKGIEDMDGVTDFDEYDDSSLEFQFTTKDMVRMHPRGDAKMVHAPKRITFNTTPEIIQKQLPLTPPESPKRVASIDREIEAQELSPLLVSAPSQEFNINSEDIYARKYPSGVGVADADSIEVTSTIGSATIEQIDQLFQGFDYDYRDKIEKKLELITRRLAQFDADMINRGTQTKNWRHSVDSVMSEQIEAVLFDISRDSKEENSIREYMRQHMETLDSEQEALIAAGQSPESSRRKSSVYYSMQHDSDTDSFASFAPSSSGSSSYESFAPSHPVPVYESSGSSRREHHEETTPLLEQGNEFQSRVPFLSKHSKSPSDSTIASTVSSVHSRRAIPTTHNLSEQSFDFGFSRQNSRDNSPGPSQMHVPQVRPQVRAVSSHVPSGHVTQVSPRRISSVAQSRESLYLDLAPSPDLHQIRPESGDSYHTASSLRPSSSELRPLKVRASPRQMAQQSPKRFSTSSIGAIGGEASWMKTPRPLPPVPVLSPQRPSPQKHSQVTTPRSIPAPSHPPPSPPVVGTPQVIPATPLALDSGSVTPRMAKPVSMEWNTEYDAGDVDAGSDHTGSSSGNPPSPPTASDQVLQRMYRELEELQQRSVQLSDMVARTEQGAPFSDTESSRGSYYLTRDSLAVIPTPSTPSFPSTFMTGATHGTVSNVSPSASAVPTTSHTTPISRGGLNRRRVRSSVFLEPPQFSRGHSRGDSAVSATSAASGSSIGLSDIPVPSSMPAPRHLVPPAEPSDANVMEWRQAIRPPFVRGPSVTRGKRLSVGHTPDLSDFQFSDEDIELQEAQVVGSRFPVLIDNSGTDRVKSVLVMKEEE